MFASGTFDVGSWTLRVGRSHCPTILLYGIIFVKIPAGSLEEGNMRLSRTGACLTVIGVYLVVRLVSPLIPATRAHGLEVFLALAAMMLVQLALALTVAGLNFRMRSTALLAVVSAILFIGMVVFARGLRHAAPQIVGSVGAVQDLLLLLAAVLMGCMAGRAIRERNIVLPIAVFAGLVDYWNVSVGPLGKIVENKPAIISAVAIHMPAPGIPTVMIGMGDFVFMALFFSAVFKLGMNVRGTFWLGYALLTATMYAVILFGGALPALLPMGIAVIGANRRYFHLKRDEQLAMLYVGVILLTFLIVSRFFGFRR
jgi:hypothetical protein